VRGCRLVAPAHAGAGRKPSRSGASFGTDLAFELAAAGDRVPARRPWTSPVHDQLSALDPQAPRRSAFLGHSATSEAARLAAAPGATVVRLAGPWSSLLHAVTSLGTVVAVTRNAWAVQERRGLLIDSRAFGASGYVLGESFQLHCMLDHWHFAFAVRAGRQTSLEFFDEDGTAVHKIFLDHASDIRAYEALVDRHRHPDQSPELPIRPRSPRVERTGAVDVAAHYAAWGSFEDGDAPAEALRRFRAERLRALRQAPPMLACPVAVQALPRVLTWVAADATPIGVSVASVGVIQTAGGPIRRAYATRHWLTVRDPGHAVRVRLDRIASAWVVRTPTRAGVVASLEAFDRAGELVVRLTGRLHPAESDSPRWRELLGRLEVAARGARRRARDRCA